MGESAGSLVDGVKVVSIDMFQTLVNVKSRSRHVWRRILGEKYSERLAEEYWLLTTRLIFKHYDELFRCQKEFVSSTTIIEMSFRELFALIGLEFNPKQAARILVEEHSLAPPYRDTEVFLSSVGERFPICLVSDADDEMILPLMKLYAFDSVFTSGRLRAYKNSPGREIFRAVIAYYGARPENIIHIGDSVYDVLGAARVGIKTCWLNRQGKSWDHELKPDYTVASLLEAASLLGIKIDVT